MWALKVILSSIAATRWGRETQHPLTEGRLLADPILADHVIGDVVQPAALE